MHVWSHYPAQDIEILHIPEISLMSLPRPFLPHPNSNCWHTYILMRPATYILTEIISCLLLHCFACHLASICSYVSSSFSYILTFNSTLNMYFLEEIISLIFQIHTKIFHLLCSNLSVVKLIFLPLTFSVFLHSYSSTFA